MAKRQATIFLEEEGDKWFERNKEPYATASDPVMDIMVGGIRPKRVLEIGCGTGWRLFRLKNKYKCDVAGIEPSFKAVQFAKKAYNLDICHGTAVTELYRFLRHDKCDLIIFGFCLYLVDREDLFTIVAYTDNILEDGGHIIIHDFLPPSPYCRPYHHKDGVMSYKQDYSKLWLGNPAYGLMGNGTVGEDFESVTVIKKRMEYAWPRKS
jgi:SAM-dependent methyltransferase